MNPWKRAPQALINDIKQNVAEPFELESLTVTLDGVSIYDKPSGKTKLPMIYIINISQGKHELAASALYAGGGYKLFPADSENKYPAQLKESIEVNRNEVLLVKVVCNDRLGLLKNLNDPS